MKKILAKLVGFLILLVVGGCDTNAQPLEGLSICEEWKGKKTLNFALSWKKDNKFLNVNFDELNPDFPLAPLF
jgi:hypothetical protein